MQPDSPASRTAIMVAAYRARASTGEASLCDDPWAEKLAGVDGLELAERFDARFPHMELWMGLRTAYLDRQLEYWTGEHGFGQVVVLGAGLDTRAARLGRAGVRFFEVDHPATQAEKRERLSRIDGYPIDDAVYVPCDFESGQDFLEQLTRPEAGFDPGASAVVLWEGVTPYLTEAAVRGTASRIAGGMHPRSILLFDYLPRRMAAGADLRDKDLHTRDYVDQLGEPIRWGTNDVLPLLFESGFRHVRTVTFDEIALSLTGTYDRAREFRFQSIALTSVTAPAIP